MMTDCDCCTSAKSAADYPMYRAKCRGCLVRSIATGPVFWQSEQDGKLTSAYRQALERAFPGDWKTAHAEIKVEAERIRALRATERRGTP